MNIPNKFNYAGWVLNNTQNLADNIAVIDANGQTTYKTLADKVKSVAHALTLNGLDREQRIAIVMYDSVDSVCLLLGAMYAGMVPVILDPRGTATTINYCIEHCGARLVFVEDELSDTIVNQNKIVSSAINKFYQYETDALPADTHKDEPCVFIYTSGTTGHPKAVVHGHSMPYIVGNLVGKDTFHLTTEDRIFATAKLFFSFGLYGLWNTFAAGASVVLNPKVSMPNIVAGLINQHQPTVTISVPVIYGMLLSKEINNPKLRICQAGGDKLPETVATRWLEKVGVRLNNSYGTTEVCTACLFNDSTDNPTSIGRAINGYEFEVRDSDGRKVADDTIGELYIKAPSAGLMYWHDKDWSLRTFSEWMPTGDMCKQDSKGFFTFFGRAGDVFKVNGKFFDVTSVEEAFLGYTGVNEAAVVGVQDDNGRTKLSAYLVIDEGVNISDVKTHVLSKHSVAECPREISIVTQLPRTSTGKIQRYLLKESK